MLHYIKVFFIGLSVYFTQISWIQAQELACETLFNPDVLRGINIERESRAENHYTVRIFLHIVNHTDGNGGIDIASVYDELKVVEEDFAPHNICFALIGLDTINNSYYTNNNDDWGNTIGKELVQVNSHLNAIDIYIVPESTEHSGKAYGIPSTNLTMGAQRVGRRTMSHEIGHCLGLYHTHETAFGMELVDESNCSSAGDKICDTPADPNVSQAMSGCTYTGIMINNDGTITLLVDNNGAEYQADPGIIMSYGEICRNYFTNGQGSRMRAYLSMSKVVVNDNTLTLHSQYLPTGEVFEVANNTIIAGDLLGLASERYIVSRDAYVTHTAKHIIALKPGFLATPGIKGQYLASVQNYMCQQTSAIEAIVEEAGVPLLSTVNEISFVTENMLDISLLTYPNPFSATTIFEFQLPKAAEVSLYIRNTMGQIVARPAYKEQKYAGIHNIEWNGHHLPSGIYYLILETVNEKKVEKIVLVK